MAASTTTSVYQFKISLSGSRPVIWRRVQFPANITFHDLHKIIIDSMEWCGSYSYSFTVNSPVDNEKISIGCTGYGESGLRRICAVEAKVVNYISNENKKAIYEYCGYEGWKFEILFQKMINLSSEIQLPRCLTGKRAAPEEITRMRGGIRLYQDFLRYIKQVDHPDYQQRMEEINEVYEDGFNPDVFDAENITFEGHRMVDMVLNRCNC